MRRVCQQKVSVTEPVRENDAEFDDDGGAKGKSDGRRKGGAKSVDGVHVGSGSARGEQADEQGQEQGARN